MKLLYTLMLILLLTSCTKTETVTETQTQRIYMRIEAVGITGDTTYSDISVININ